jgi:hypothetical protein
MFVEAERLLSIAFIGNDRFGSTAFQPQSQFGAVVCLVTDQSLRRLASAD